MSKMGLFFKKSMRNIVSCLVIIFKNCFLFSKTRRIKKKAEKTCLVHFFYSKKHK